MTDDAQTPGAGVYNLLRESRKWVACVLDQVRPFASGACRSGDELLAQIDAALATQPPKEGGEAVGGETSTKASPPDSLTRDEMRRRAKAMLASCGVKPHDRIVAFSVADVMAEFGMDLAKNPAEDRCGYPSCGCDDDGACPEVHASLTPQPDDLGKLSDAATPGLIKACPSVEYDYFGIYPDTGKMEFPIAFMPDIIKAALNQANAVFLCRLWNDYRSGRLVSAPAAPQATAEPVAKRVAALLSALKPFAEAAHRFEFAVGPDGYDDGLTITASVACRPEIEAILSTSSFSYARSVYNTVANAGEH